MDRDNVPGIPAGDWIGQLYRRRGHRFPLQASLELTERCNLQCVHCYINRPAGDPDARGRELTLPQWQDILDQMQRAGILWLLITGGEPLLRPDFPEIYTYAKGKGFHITLFTNGTLLTLELADMLAEQPPWKIEITLYGATAATYERVTGVPGSYARCLQAIDLLLERDVYLNLKTVALTLNVHEIVAIAEMATKWGAEFRYDPLIHSRIDGDHGTTAYRLSPEDIVTLERNDPERLQLWQDYCAATWLPPDRDHLFTCGAGELAFHVDAYGGLYPCILARWLRYDLPTGSLEEALRKFLPSVRLQLVTHDHTCWECESRILCQHCPGWAYVESGNPEAPDPFRCRLSRLRRQELGFAVQMWSELENEVQHKTS